MTELFDMRLRGMRRDRAARMGTELFLHDRAFADVLERIALMGRHFRRALLMGSPNPGWAAELGNFAGTVQPADPGELFASASGGLQVREDRLDLGAGRFDLIVAIGTLDTVNELPLALALLGRALDDGGFLCGAMSGGETLPQLRSAMRAADGVARGAAAHVHPRIEPAQLGPLLEQAGLSRPVVDVDRVNVAYREFDRLIRDLRTMGATNVLNARPRAAVLKAGLKAAQAAFGEAGVGGRTVETFEILHFAAWKGTPHGGASFSPER